MFMQFKIIIPLPRQAPLHTESSKNYLIACTCINSISIFLFKVNNKNIKTICETCLKLVIKTPEQRQCHRSGVFIVNFEHVSHIVLVFPLLNMNKQTGWVLLTLSKYGSHSSPKTA